MAPDAADRGSAAASLADLAPDCWEARQHLIEVERICAEFDLPADEVLPLYERSLRGLLGEGARIRDYLSLFAAHRTRDAIALARRRVRGG